MGLFKEAARHLDYILIQLEFKYTKSSKHLDIYWAHKLLGISHRHLGNIRNALSHLETALDIATGLFSSEGLVLGSGDMENLEMASIFLALSQSLLESNNGDLERAYKLGQNALRALTESGKKEAKVAKVHFLLGLAALKLGKS